jgi:hypothetical protein
MAALFLVGAMLIETGALGAPPTPMGLSGWRLPAVSTSDVGAGSVNSTPAAVEQPIWIDADWQPAVERPAALPTDPPHAADPSDIDTRPHLSFGERVGAAKWEAAGLFGYMTVTQIAVTKGTRSFHFQDEGWFGKDTTNLGIDKLTHAFNSYMLAELLHWRISRKTGDDLQRTL